MRAVLYLHNAQQAWTAIRALWVDIKPWLIAGHRLVLEVRKERRSDPQNRRMWAMLRDISDQVEWYGQRLTDDEWKDVFSASLKRQKVVPGLDGGFVVCGQRTSEMTKAEHGELQDLMGAFGAERAVRFRDSEPNSEAAVQNVAEAR
jgi:hypothetical protein